MDRAKIAPPTYRKIIPSPVGDLALECDHQGIRRLDVLPLRLPSSMPPALETHSNAGPELKAAYLIATQAATELSEYFSGTRHVFTVPLVPVSASRFTAQVHRAMLNVPYGHTVSYSELATAAGAPRAYRAAASVCARNPLPIFIPCHRIVPMSYRCLPGKKPSSSSIGNYSPGPAIKAFLLDLEAGY